MTEKFCLKWNDFHSNIGKSFKSLRYEDDLLDVTLVSDDNSQVSAHKLVLSACSEYFKNIFKNNKHSHPLLCLEGVSSQDLNNVLDYIYNGEIQIFQDNLDRFLDVAQRFKLEGLKGDEKTTKNEDFIVDVNINDNPNENFAKKIQEIGSTKLNHTRMVAKSSSNAVSSLDEIILGDFKTIDELNQSIEEEIVRESNGVYKCNRCQKSFTKISNVKEHIEKHFDGLSFPCQTCGKDFRSRPSLRQHIKFYHRN